MDSLVAKGNASDISWISLDVVSQTVKQLSSEMTVNEDPASSIEPTIASEPLLQASDNSTLPPHKLSDLIYSPNVTTGNGVAQKGHLPMILPGWDLGHFIGQQTTLTLMGIGGSVILFLIIFIVIRRWKYLKYHTVPTYSSNGFLYIYKPMVGNKELDEEYENTFVGVSVPLLQETTKI